MTDKADTVRESPTNQEIVADLPVMTVADQTAEADITNHHSTAIGTEGAPHHSRSTPSQLQSRNPLKQQTLTVKTSQ